MDENSKLKVEPTTVETPAVVEPVAVTEPSVAPAAQSAKPLRKTNKLVMWVVAAIVVIAAGTYAALALMGGDKDDPEQQVVSYVAALPSITSGEIDFTITMIDAATPEEPFMLTGQAMMNEEGAGITATLNVLPVNIDLRIFDDALYAKVEGVMTALAAFPEYAAIGESFAALDGAWLGLNFSDLAAMGMTQESVSNLPSLSEAETTALLDLMAEHPPFNVAESTDNKQIGDLQLTKKYEITFDATEAKLFITGVRDLNLAALASYNLDYNAALEAIDNIESSVAEAGLSDLALTVWADEQYIRHIELTLSADGTVFEVLATVTSINEPVSIDVPVVDYSLSEILSGFMTGLSESLDYGY